MQISVLASGSKGNCVLVKEKNTAILIDAGISARKIKKELAALHMDADDLDGILITHEHTDHIRGLKTLAKNCRAQIYTQAGTFEAMPFFADLPKERCCVLSGALKIGGLNIEWFPVSHDAAEPVGYSVKAGRRKFTLATDLGFVSSSVMRALYASNIVVLEANHDIGMLQSGPYPWPLKKRILSDKGHLSNNEAARTLRDLAHTPDGIILAHLSEKNNTPETAVNAVRTLMREDDFPAPVCAAGPNDVLSLEF